MLYILIAWVQLVRYSSMHGSEPNLRKILLINDRNFEGIYQHRFKRNSRIQLDNLKPLLTLNVEYLHHVTCYRFLTQKEN